MRVQMRVKITGDRNGVEWPNAGDVLEVSDLEGAELIGNGMAVPAEKPAPEAATAPVAENAAAPKARARKAAPSS
jgi:hypothetical protein